MSEKYSEGLVLKEISKCIGEYFSKASRNIPYARGYKGEVVSGSGGVYRVSISGAEHTVRTDYALNTGEIVTLISLQNQNGDFVVVPTAAQVIRTVGGN